MFTIYDTITGDVLNYESIEEFRKAAKFSFDASVHEVIDKMCDAYIRRECVIEYEQYLGIKIA